MDKVQRLARLREMARQDGVLRDIRERHHLSLMDIARSVGCDPSAVGRWERGERVPRGGSAERYARLIERLDGEARAAS